MKFDILTNIAIVMIIELKQDVLHVFPNSIRRLPAIFKKIGIIRLRSQLSLQALLTAWVFGFKCHLIIHRVEFIKPVYWCILANFHDWHWRIPGFDESKQLSIMWPIRSLQLGLGLGLKAGFKELRPELKLLNRGLRQASFCGPFFSTQNQGNTFKNSIKN